MLQKERSSERTVLDYCHLNGYLGRAVNTVADLEGFNHTEHREAADHGPLSDTAELNTHIQA